MKKSDSSSPLDQAKSGLFTPEAERAANSGVKSFKPTSPGQKNTVQGIGVSEVRSPSPKHSNAEKRNNSIFSHIQDKLGNSSASKKEMSSTTVRVNAPSSEELEHPTYIPQKQGIHLDIGREQLLVNYRKICQKVAGKFLKLDGSAGYHDSLRQRKRAKKHQGIVLDFVIKSHKENDDDDDQKAS